MGGLGSGENGFSGLDIGNLCFASDCTNQNINYNQNSPVVTDSDNTSIESGEGDLNRGTNPGLGDTTEGFQTCFNLNAPGIDGLETYAAAIGNFRNNIPNNTDLQTYVVNKNIGSPPVTTSAELWNLIDSILPIDQRSQLVAYSFELINESGFTEAQRESLNQCINLLDGFDN